jgi:hypothetical protein
VSRLNLKTGPALFRWIVAAVVVFVFFAVVGQL